MPIEVRELVIKAVVNSTEKTESKTKKPGTQYASKKNIIDGLEQVLEIIKNRNER